MKPVIVAHRGISSIQANDIAGIDYIEIDLDISRDGIIFVFHHPQINSFIFREPYIRLAKGVKKKAHELLYGEIQQLFPSVVTLTEVLQMVDPSKLVCELKSYTAYRGIIHVLHRMYPEAFHKLRFISFSMRALIEIKQIDPLIYCGYIATSIGDDNRFHFMVRKHHVQECVKNGIEEISGHWFTFRPRMIRFAHTQGLRVGIGQLNTIRRILYAQKNKVQVWYSDILKRKEISIDSV
ncbi:MAG: hypothetical protein WC099_02205 [Candidatus Paceibacterota bacterium]